MTEKVFEVVATGYERSPSVLCKTYEAAERMIVRCRAIEEKMRKAPWGGKRWEKLKNEHPFGWPQDDEEYLIIEKEVYE